MKNERYRKLLAFAASEGVKVRRTGNAHQWDAIPAWMKLEASPAFGPEFPLLNATYSPSRRNKVTVTWERNTPEWVRVGTLAHELGHHIDYTTNEDEYCDRNLGQSEQDHYYERERRATERGRELLYALGIKATDAIVGVLNLSLVTHGIYAGRDIVTLRRDFV